MWRAVLLGLLGLAAGSSGAAATAARHDASAPGSATGGPARASDPSADATAAHDLIARCAQEADAKVRGLDALRSACPGIEGAVQDLGLDALLPADWSKQASARALADLDGLVERYAGPAPTLRLSVSRLQAIAAGLKPPPAPPSLWDRIGAWIRSWLGSASAGSSGWLRFLPHWSIGARLQRLLFAALAGLILIAVGAFIAVEMRAAGLGAIRRRPQPADRRSGIGDGASPERPEDLAELDSAAPRQQPALLLRILVQALTRAHRLGRDRDLTCRELIAQARFDTAQQREDFGEVALLAERALYGSPDARPTALPDELLSGARALHAQLLAAPAGAPATAATAAATTGAVS